MLQDLIDKGWKQDDLAQELGISQPRISLIKNEKYTFQINATLMKRMVEFHAQNNVESSQAAKEEIWSDKEKAYVWDAVSTSLRNGRHLSRSEKKLLHAQVSQIRGDKICFKALKLLISSTRKAFLAQRKTYCSANRSQLQPPPQVASGNQPTALIHGPGVITAAPVDIQDHPSFRVQVHNASNQLMSNVAQLASKGVSTSTADPVQAQLEQTKIQVQILSKMLESLAARASNQPVSNMPQVQPLGGVAQPLPANHDFMNMRSPATIGLAQYQNNPKAPSAVAHLPYQNAAEVSIAAAPPSSKSDAQVHKRKFEGQQGPVLQQLLPLSKHPALQGRAHQKFSRIERVAVHGGGGRGGAANFQVMGNQQIASAAGLANSLLVSQRGDSNQHSLLLRPVGHLPFSNIRGSHQANASVNGSASLDMFRAANHLVLPVAPCAFTHGNLGANQSQSSIMQAALACYQQDDFAKVLVTPDSEPRSLDHSNLTVSPKVTVTAIATDGVGKRPADKVPPAVNASPPSTTKESTQMDKDTGRKQKQIALTLQTLNSLIRANHSQANM